ncbi:MAG: RidA family protein [Angustibacter sp.]
MGQAPQASDGSGPGAAERRLTQLGLVLPAVAAPVAAYVPAVRDGDLVWTSGQVPVVDGVLAETGIVGEGEGFVSPARAKELARICTLNALAAVKSVVGDLDAVRRVVKVVGFVASDQSFTGQPTVINGASELLGQVFGDAGAHARSAVGVASLPLGAPVEVEITVRVG